MRKLRLLLVEMVIVSLLGLAGFGPATAVDDSCPGSEKAMAALKEAKDQYWRDVNATEAVVADLDGQIQRLELQLQALHRQRTEAASRESDAYERWDEVRQTIIRCTGAMRTLRVDGLAEPIWQGDNIHYNVRCYVESNENQVDMSPPHRHANNPEELRDAIKNMPNGCVSDEGYTRNLAVEVLRKDTDEVLETVGRETVMFE